ncbi:MAG: diphthine--ammonia ligase [Desulfurococcales archaeon]|nr:diphthine--ammonia ligase [Desulfurococcales archaeon]
MLKKAIALYTGGKDSHYSIIKALEAGVKVAALITAVPKLTDSWMFHSVNLRYVKLHAQAMNLPLYMISVSGVKEKEVEELRNYIKGAVLSRHDDVDYIISGATASRYQKERVDSLAEELGLKHLAPLWGCDPVNLLAEEVNYIDFIIVAVQAFGLTARWLGKLVSHKDLSDFVEICRKFGINPVGEGGEIETFVISSPLFHGHAVRIHKSVVEWFPELHYGYYLIEDATLT